MFYSPSPKFPARKSGDEWRGEPSEALAKEGYREFCILIIDAPAGARGASLCCPCSSAGLISVDASCWILNS